MGNIQQRRDPRMRLNLLAPTAGEDDAEKRREEARGHGGGEDASTSGGICNGDSHTNE